MRYVEGEKEQAFLIFDKHRFQLTAVSSLMD
jgi:hypothetical protein